MRTFSYHKTLFVVIASFLSLFVFHNALASQYLTLPLNPASTTIVVNSIFDHTAPGSSADGNVTRFDGAVGLLANGDCAPSNSLGEYYTQPGGGECLVYDGHNGIDYSASIGTDVLAAAPGTAEEYFTNCGGNTVRLQHTGEGHSTLYAHLSQFLFSIGASVDRSEVFALSGNTAGMGCSTGPHLHFGVIDGFSTVSSNRIDPYGWSGTTTDPWPYNQGYLWTTNPPSLTPPVIYVSGTISQDTTWESGNVYVIQSSVTVSASTTLTIKPGVVVKFNSGAMYVFGTLDAQGVATNTIYFTSLQDDSVAGDTNGDGSVTTPAQSDYYGIFVYDTGTATINQARLRYGGKFSNDAGGLFNGVLRLGGGTATVTNSVINKNNYGVYQKGGSITILRSSIYNNSNYGIYNVSLSIANAINNYWGHASGPYHPTLNPNGTGDIVSNDVDFIPWLTKNPTPIGSGGQCPPTGCP
ncbi:MAG: peptidoglycan DD-metalloendopeptidase family protein [Patescibacteria group bacterium]